MATWWKIVEQHPSGIIKTLFHGLNGSRKLDKDKWLKANMRMVSDGSGPIYLSGWHVLPTKKEAKQYLTRFTKRTELLTIVECEAKNLRPKEHSRNRRVFLAEYIKLI